MVSLVKCHEKGVFKSVQVLMVSHIVFLRWDVCQTESYVISVLDQSLLTLHNARAEFYLLDILN